ncbi:uncharacterized protein LOC134241447, partial [Saccostrea cucullata]|uniref:uncharacterized protein LOC134241447 n=1 Tax=Saccostrea cuccullata TaxID=36930 RepID=UPI002ED5B46B
KGEACGHIAALLFALDDFVAKGLKDLPEDRSSTEKLCQWNKPAKRKTEPKTIHNIRIVKQEPGKVVKGRETLASLEFDPRPPVDQLQEEESKSRLTEALEGANPTCGFIKYNKPVPDVPNVTESSLLTKEIVSTVKHFTDFELPPSILDLKNACMYFKDSLHLDGNEVVELESRTRGQSSSQEWHSARKYRLTASDFHKVFVRRSTTDPSKLLRYFLYNKMKPTNAMLFGLQQEKKAIEKFKSKLVEQGIHVHDVIVEQKGLVVDSHCTFLGASVDGIALINGEQFVLELKNPASTWDMDIPSAAKKLPCLKMNENNEVCLNVKHSYYTQIQGQMGILNISKCYFVLCTKNDIHIEMVTFDKHFWERVLHKLTQFYDYFMLPEIVYPSVKFGLPAFDISKF